MQCWGGEWGRSALRHRVTAADTCISMHGHPSITKHDSVQESEGERVT